MGVQDHEFDDFVARELGGLLRYAVVLTGDRELAADLVQDVLLKAFRQWSRVGSADRPERYVRTMVTNAFLSWRRRWSVRNVFLTRDAEVDGPARADHGASVALHDAVWRRLADLPRRQRVVLVLRYYEELTDNEIAEVLGCSAGTVRGYASRALATLRLDPEPLATAPAHQER